MKRILILLALLSSFTAASHAAAPPNILLIMVDDMGYSDLGSGPSHSNKDLPVLLVGGRFKHGRHLTIEPGTVPLSNLYLSVPHQLGMDDKSFGTSTGTLKGLTIVQPTTTMNRRTLLLLPLLSTASFHEAARALLHATKP
jgi:hypothetical protein